MRVISQHFEILHELFVGREPETKSKFLLQVTQSASDVDERVEPNEPSQAQQRRSHDVYLVPFLVRNTFSSASGTDVSLLGATFIADIVRIEVISEISVFFQSATNSMRIEYIRI